MVAKYRKKACRDRCVAIPLWRAGQRPLVQAIEAEVAARDQRQARLARFVVATWGQDAAAPHERALRLLEEALELVQAVGVIEEQAGRLVKYTFGRPAGDPQQEAGGVGIALLGMAASLGFSADKAEAAELARIEALPAEHFRKRHNAKADAGIAVRGIEP